MNQFLIQEVFLIKNFIGDFDCDSNVTLLDVHV